jgi:FHA domain-containing protein
VPILRDFERRLGGLVEGLFSKTFRSGVQPVELAKRILRAMDDGKTVGVSEVWAPNRFTFHLSAEDAERFKDIEAALVAELKQVVRDNAGERGWGLPGPPEVILEADEGLRRGDLRCEAALVQGEDRVVPTPQHVATASLVIHQDAQTESVPLEKETLTIGRLPDCDIVLKDRGASRRHAQIRTHEGTSTLMDLGSTNGTRLNGETVQTRELRDGDRITIGETLIEYREG